VTSFDAGVWGAGGTALALLLAMGAATWAASVFKRDVSIVDAVWSLLILAAAVVYVTAPQAAGPRAPWVLALTVVWALRLCLHIALRGWGEPEDHRYQAIRARNEPGFAWKSLYLVFGLQAVLAWIVSLPLLAAVAGMCAPGWLDAAGGLLIVAGILIESVADWQLTRFRAKPGNRGRVLDRGLWRYSRHPNYFGEFCVWWGFYLVAASAGGVWSIVSPLLMSLLLLRVSGVTLLEAGMAERRPAYRDYVATTNAFFPGPRRRGAALVR
jgi:steroid 5-alpha reductase family enzyme